VCDISKRAAVDQRRGAFQSLHQIRLDRILKQGAHGSLRLELGGGDGLVVVSIADNHLAKAFLHVADGG